MGDSNKQICRLCLKLTPTFECKSVQEVKKEIQEGLLINMDFDRSERAVACDRCMERLQNCLDFKSFCVNSFVDISVSAYNEKVLQTEVTTNDGVCRENPRVCRFCVCLIEDDDFNCVTDIEDMMRKCFPELDLIAVREFLICKICLGSMKRYCEFMKSLQEVEQRIELYCRATGHGSADRIILKDILKFKDSDMSDTPVVIKDECLDVENIDAREMEYIKTEEFTSIKCEEIDVKDEIDYREETCASDQLEAKDASSETKSSPSERARKSTGSVHWCPTCLYETNRVSNLKRHLLKHKDISDVVTHDCPACSFKSKYKSVMVSHWKLLHNTKMENYRCTECLFMTKSRKHLQTHRLLHKSAEEIPKFSCDVCNYVTNNRKRLLNHKRIHQEATFQCYQCSYLTKRKEYLRSHMYKHNPSAQSLFECDKCEYRTRLKASLHRHQLKHKLTDTEMYTCERCDFKSKYKKHLKRHTDSCLKMKKNDDTYSCDVCNYSTSSKINLVVHKRVHQEAKLQCCQCNYRTKRKDQLQIHMYMHNPSAEPAFQCDKCGFHTNLKASLHRHLLRHRNLSDTEIKRDGKKLKNKQGILRCDICDYLTNDRSHLRRHKGIHMEAKFQCSLCSYRATRKDTLQSHMKRHNLSERPILECDKCEYRTLIKATLLKHLSSHKKVSEISAAHATM